MIKGFIPLYLIVCLALVVVLSLFGKEYPLRLDYLSLFALVSTLFFFQCLYDTIILDLHKKKYFIYVLMSNVVNLLTVLAYYLILRSAHKSISFVLIGFALNLIVSILIQRAFVKRMRA